MGTTFEERRRPWITTVDVDDIHSGDFLALSKIRGPWGAFETLQKWVTGSYAGHSAVFLRDSEGKLWVAESGRGNGVVCVLLFFLQEDNVILSCRRMILFKANVCLYSSCRRMILLMFYHGISGGTTHSITTHPIPTLHFFPCILICGQSLMRLLHGSMPGAWLGNHMVIITWYLVGLTPRMETIHRPWMPIWYKSVPFFFFKFLIRNNFPFIWWKEWMIKTP